MPDWNSEEAEQELEEYIIDWAKKNGLRNVVVVDMLLRKTVEYHMKELTGESG